MKKTTFSLIVTVFNEERSIVDFLESVYSQSRLPDEVIVVDGGSSDDTVAKIQKFSSDLKTKLKIKVIVKKGNRSVGRNEAIKNAKGEIILSSDAGCTLDKKWVEKIIKPFEDKAVDVVAGYYKGLSKNIFEKSLIPYVLVMEDKIDATTFLPATRSMAFRKNVWQKICGFDEKLSHNEDYVFSNRIKDLNIKIIFVKNALVYWKPRKNLKKAFTMFLRFAFGDAESGILRDKVLLIFARYIFYAYLLILTVLIKSPVLVVLTILFPILYVSWAASKNYRYVKNIGAYFWLPMLQVTSDIAVLVGTVAGILRSLTRLDYKKIIGNNLAVLLLLVIYIVSMLVVINTGIPNQAHPFPYQMDEWHQLQSVRNVFKFGTPNMISSANGSMFHFFYSGIMLLPFIALKIVNPFAIKSSLDSISMQRVLFIIFRLNTLFFGVLTLVLISKIAKILRLNSPMAVLLFFLTSAWLVLSNFFKYDIALTFWIVLSMFYLIKYSISPTLRNFTISSLLAGLAFSVKVSGLPLLPIIILAYLFFTPSIRKNIKVLLLGVSIYLFTVVFFGIPDLIFGGRNMWQYIYDNVIKAPGSLSTFNFGQPILSFTVLNRLPVIFGHLFYVLSFFSFIYFLIITVSHYLHKQYKEFKFELFLVLSFLIFTLSILLLGLTLSANRALVILPFMVVFCLYFLRDLFRFLQAKSVLRLIIIIFFVLFLVIQTTESYLWLYLKMSPLPEQTSSAWILKNIPKGANIGLENIPLYQFEPDFILKEFYQKQYNSKANTRYRYLIVNNKTNKLPSYVILSNVYFEKKYLKVSDKNNLVYKMKQEGYRDIKNFSIELPIYSRFDSNYYTPYFGLLAYPETISVFSK